MEITITPVAKAEMLIRRPVTEVFSVMSRQTSTINNDYKESI